MNQDVVGIDPSMTSTGISLNGTPIRVKSPSTKLPPGKKQHPWRHRFNRLDDIVERVCECVPLGALVIYEGPSYSSKGSSSHDIAGTWWSIARELQRERQAHILVAAPSIRMKYATGKGVADKDMVLAAAVKRYPDIDITGNDVADATLFYAIGKRLLGEPIEATLPVANLKALDTLMEDWKQIESDLGIVPFLIPIWWSVLLTAIGVTGLFIVSNKKWYGFAIGLFAQTLWIAYAIATKQWPFLGSAFAYGYVNVRGWRNFRRDDREKKDAETGA